MQTKIMSSVLLASLVVMSSIAVMMVVMQSATADTPHTKDTRCLPRSEFNGKDNAGNEHFNKDGSPDQTKNPHDSDSETGDRFVGNPHDRCEAGEGS